MRKILALTFSLATAFFYNSVSAACCGPALADATNAGLRTMTNVLQGNPKDGRSLSAIRAELVNINNNLANQGQLLTSLQSATNKHKELLMANELLSLNEIAKREQMFKASQTLDRAYGSFNEDEACALYDQAVQQLQGDANYQKLVGLIGQSFSDLYNSISHSTETTEAILNLKALEADQILPQSGFYESPEAAVEAMRSAAFIVNPYPMAQIPKERWQGSVFGENWKEENNRLQVRLAPVKAAMADIIAGYTPSFPLDERMKSVLELSPYTVDQVTVNGEISKNLYLELLGSSRYYNPKYIAHITASRGDALLRESIFAYSDLLMLENETLKVEQQNTALLAVIASTAINARTEERLKEAAQGVANH